MKLECGMRNAEWGMRTAAIALLVLALLCSSAQAYTDQEEQAAYKKVCNAIIPFDDKGHTAKIEDYYILWLVAGGCDAKGWTSRPSFEPLGIEIIFLFTYPNSSPGIASWIVTPLGREIIPTSVVSRSFGTPRPQP